MWTRRNLYRVICVAGSLLFVLLVDQTLLRLFPYQGELGYLRKADGEPALYFIERGKPRLFGDLSLRKSPDTVRIFTFGGSSTWGLPYGASGSFSGWLAEILQSLEPERKVEVVNTGYPSAPLATVRDYAEASIPFRPDIFIVYSGNNEFLLENQILRETAIEPRIIHWLRRKLKYRSFLFFTADRLFTQAASAKQVYDPQKVRFTDYAARVDAQFQDELRAILRVAQRHSVKVILCTVACNERDYAPMTSAWADNLSAMEQSSCESLLDHMRRVIAVGRLDQAESTYAQLCAVSPGYAQATFEMASAYLAAGRRLAAQQAFRRAKEEDRALVRVKARFNSLIRSELTRYDNPDTVICDVERAFCAASPDGVPGNNLFLDGMHPNLQGHFAIARLCAELICSRGWLRTRHPPSDILSYEHYRELNCRIKDEDVLETGGYFVRLGRYARAREIFDGFLRQHDHWQAHLNLSVIELASGTTTGAVAQARLAYESAGSNFNILVKAVGNSYPKWLGEFEALSDAVQAQP